MNLPAAEAANHRRRNGRIMVAAIDAAAMIRPRTNIDHRLAAADRYLSRRMWHTAAEFDGTAANMHRPTPRR